MQNLGQIMTPRPLIQEMLDLVGYKGKGKILEPSFGSGGFLIEIVQRIKEQCSSHNDWVKTVQDTVFGYEIDKTYYEGTVQELHEILPEVDWQKNLLLGDALKLWREDKNRYDFVVGNPPFHRTKASNFVQFSHCKGVADTYIAFYELGIQLLNDTGRLGYVSSNGFLFNKSQQGFRDYLVSENLMDTICDYKDEPLFKGVSVYTCLTVLSKKKKNTAVYIDRQRGFETEWQPKDYLGKEWLIVSEDDRKFLEEVSKRGLKLKDIAQIQNGVETNRDSIYIRDVYVDRKMTQKLVGETESHATVYLKEDSEPIGIESGILRPIVKATTLEKKWIIFPYKTKATDTGYRPMTEIELRSQYPKAYEYLLSKRDELEKRDMSNGLDWFLFARTQGLASMNQPKIVFKHMFKADTERFEPMELPSETLTYSKIYITTDQKEKVMRILGSRDFARYCALTGLRRANGYVIVGVKQLRQYGVPEEE